MALEDCSLSEAARVLAKRHGVTARLGKPRVAVSDFGHVRSKPERCDRYNHDNGTGV